MYQMHIVSASHDKLTEANRMRKLVLVATLLTQQHWFTFLSFSNNTNKRRKNVLVPLSFCERTSHQDWKISTVSSLVRCVLECASRPAAQPRENINK